MRFRSDIIMIIIPTGGLLSANDKIIISFIESYFIVY